MKCLRLSSSHLRIVGSRFLVLSAHQLRFPGLLLSREAARQEPARNRIAVVSLFVMPLVSRVKKRFPIGLGRCRNGPTARQADFSTYL
jgi:hypothetical protein